MLCLIAGMATFKEVSCLSRCGVKPAIAVLFIKCTDLPHPYRLTCDVRVVRKATSLNPSSNVDSKNFAG